MHRIDGPTRAPVMPPAAPTGAGASSPGFFGKGDPAAGVPATTLDADWANSIQEELATFIEHFGIALDKSNNGQLLAAFLQAIGGGGTTGVNVNGRWEKRASGVVEQWGYVAGSFGEGSQPVTFPIAFPNACENIQVTAINATGVISRDIWGEAQSWSQTGAVIFLNYVQANGIAACDGFFWVAKGN